MKSDVREVIKENIWVYSLCLAGDISFDYLIKLINNVRGYASNYPLSFGIAQTIVATFFVILLLRSLNRWRYYS